ncbi:hypothetical protein K440DRAFT_47531 [Wilcoxina mikolae CBS 423.85]|nr:hypothetical protein K440DRAFT_47531 [Wilcoxina mikolae CBS 423.85]
MWRSFSLACLFHLLFFFLVHMHRSSIGSKSCFFLLLLLWLCTTHSRGWGWWNEKLPVLAFACVLHGEILGGVGVVSNNLDGVTYHELFC